MKHAIDTQARRDRGVDHRPDRVQRDDGAGPASTASPSSPTTPTAAKSNGRLAYIGQDNYQSGLELGARIVGLVPQGEVCIFVATPNQQNIQPRVDGALDAIRDSGKAIRVHVVGERRRRRRRARGRSRRPTRRTSTCAACSRSTPARPQGVADVMRAHGLHATGVRAGGYDLLPETLRGDPRRPPRLHDRPAALSAGVPARAAALPRPVHGGLVVARRHEHRPQVRHPPERRAVPDDEIALRGLLGAEVFPVAPRYRLHPGLELIP